MYQVSNTHRCDVVFIRKSSQAQDENGQIENVRSMLSAIGKTVPEQDWFVGTVSRRKVRANAHFARLMEMVEADKVSTVYIESQDRWGTKDRIELFNLFGILREHETGLYDLRAKKDLTDGDFMTDMMAVLNSFKSEKELQDISYRSLRTRVNNFKDSGSWPTGTHPFGYGKSCYSKEGQLLWRFEPVSRTLGYMFEADANGNLVTPEHPKLEHIKRKGKRDKIVLVPSQNKEHVKTVRMVFDLYARVGLSRRRISAQLNKEGRRFYEREFSHTFVGQILGNAAYVGDTHFGKTRAGELHSFDGDGLVVPIKKFRGIERRTAEDRIIKSDTHEGLVDRETWKLTQDKLASEKERTCFSPRNSAYYLKTIFVCGHCGCGMTGRTEIDPSSKHRKVVYVCSSYMKGRSAGSTVSCGYQRIAHDEAEGILLDKIKELDLRFDHMASENARANLAGRLARLGHDDEETQRRWEQWTMDGVNALVKFIDQTYKPDTRAFAKLRKLAARHYWDEGTPNLSRLPLDLDQFRKAIQDAEETVAAAAQEKVDQLRAEHKRVTKAWARASDLQQNILKEDIAEMEAEIERLRQQAIPLSQRLDILYQAEAARTAERDKLLAEWPAMQDREKGEALRRLFKEVKLFWSRTFRPSAAAPTRPRKTDRPGRFSYTLEREQIQWSLAECDLGVSW